MDDYAIQVDIKPAEEFGFTYLSLSMDGLLTVSRYYAWDGPSGPTLDTRDFMRGSLVHDALYQLMRLRVLDYRVHRKRADQLLREICLEDGMCRLRAWYVYHALRIFASGSARPRKEPEMEIICVP